LEVDNFSESARPGSSRESYDRESNLTRGYVPHLFHPVSVASSNDVEPSIVLERAVNVSNERTNERTNVTRLCSSANNARALISPLAKVILLAGRMRADRSWGFSPTFSRNGE